MNAKTITYILSLIMGITLSPITKPVKAAAAAELPAADFDDKKLQILLAEIEKETEIANRQYEQATKAAETAQQHADEVTREIDTLLKTIAAQSANDPDKQSIYKALETATETAVEATKSAYAAVSKIEKNAEKALKRAKIKAEEITKAIYTAEKSTMAAIETKVRSMISNLSKIALLTAEKKAMAQVYNSKASKYYEIIVDSAVNISYIEHELLAEKVVSASAAEPPATQQTVTDFDDENLQTLLAKIEKETEIVNENYEHAVEEEGIAKEQAAIARDQIEILVHAIAAQSTDDPEEQKHDLLCELSKESLTSMVGTVVAAVDNAQDAVEEAKKNTRDANHALERAKIAVKDFIEHIYVAEKSMSSDMKTQIRSVLSHLSRVSLLIAEKKVMAQVYALQTLKHYEIIAEFIR